jgi:hypothetical protein
VPLIVLLLSAAAAAQPVSGRDAAAAPFASQIQTVTPIIVGGRVDWLPAGAIAFDRLGATDALSDVYVMRPNGTDMRCLTCGAAGVPQANNGNPAWHPSGYLVAFQAQNPALPVLPVEKAHAANLLTSPGWGTNHNLWLAMADGSRFWQLTDIQAGMAILHPHFNSAGTRLVWSEKIGFTATDEQWVIRHAALSWTGAGPALTDVQTIAPLGTAVFYEAHEFTRDGRQILLSAGYPAQSSLDVYVYDLASGDLRNLTNSPGEYDEHAHFTPDGSRIVFASSRDIPIPRQYFVPYLDYWSMNPDGTDRQRLTFFNQPGAREYYANGIVCGDISFGPDGWMAAKLEVGGIDPTIPIFEMIVAIR